MSSARLMDAFLSASLRNGAAGKWRVCIFCFLPQFLEGHLEGRKAPRQLRPARGGACAAESGVRGVQMVLSLKALVWGRSGNCDGPWVLALELHLAWPSDLGPGPLVANQCPHPGPLAGPTTMALSRAGLGPDSR